MPEWLYEEGIGENRAILVDGDHIVEAAIELPAGIRFGAIIPARLSQIHVAGRRGLAVFEGGEAIVEPLPRHMTQGQAIRIEIVREPIPEAGKPKPARARCTEEAPRQGPALLERIGSPVPQGFGGVDRFEAAGWSELLEEATTGEIGFAGGSLRMSVTPAMTLFDVDGALPPAELAVAGAEAAAHAIRRFGIGGSIGVDLPTVAGKAERQAPAAALDALLPQPFERTGVNGFGFLQIVRRRARASLPELLQGDPVGAAARALLRRAEHAPGVGERILRAAPSVIARIEANAGWRDRLTRRIGATVVLQAEPGLAISAGHVHSLHV